MTSLGRVYDLPWQSIIHIKMNGYTFRASNYQLHSSRSVFFPLRVASLVRELSTPGKQKLFPFVKMLEKHEGISSHLQHIKWNWQWPVLTFYTRFQFPMQNYSQYYYFSFSFIFDPLWEKELYITLARKYKIFHEISQTSVARTLLGPWKLVETGIVWANEGWL